MDHIRDNSDPDPAYVLHLQQNILVLRKKLADVLNLAPTATAEIEKVQKEIRSLEEELRGIEGDTRCNQEAKQHQMKTRASGNGKHD